MKKYLTYGFLAAVAASLAMVTALAWLLGTASGARWLLRELPRVAPVEIRVERVEGRLWGDLRMEGLRLSWPLGTAEAKNLHLRWRPFALFTGRVVVTELSLVGALIKDNRPESPEPPQFLWPSFPGILNRLNARLDSLQISDLIYFRSEQEPIEIRRLSTGLRLSEGTLTATPVIALLPSARIEGEMSVGLREPRLRAKAVLFPSSPMATVNRLMLKADIAPASTLDEAGGTVEAVAFSDETRQWEMTGQIGLTKQSLRISEIKIVQPGSRAAAQGAGEVSVATGKPAVRLHLGFSGIDRSPLSPFLTDISGAIDVSGTPEHYRGSFSVSSLLRGKTLTGTGEMRLEKGNVIIERIAITGDGINVKVSGELLRQISVSARLSDLSLFLPEVRGTFHIDGWVRLRSGRASGAITAEGEHFSALGVKASSWDLSARLEDGKGFPFSLDAQAENLLYGTFAVDSATVNAKGTLTHHQVRMEARSPAFQFQTRLSGSSVDQTWQGKIAELSGSDAQGPWRMETPTSLNVSLKRFSLSTLVLTGPGNERFEIDGSGALSPPAGRLRAEWRDINLARATTWLPVGFGVSGRLSGAGEGELLPDGRVQVSGKASVSQGEVRRRIAEVELRAALSKAELAWSWRGETLNGKVSLVFSEQGTVRASFTLPLPARLPVSPVPSGPVSLSAEARVREMGALAAIFPGMVRETRGKVELDLRLGGTWNEPQLSGSLLVEDAGATVPAAGIQVSDVQVKAIIAGSRLQIDSFHARSGPGSISGTATVSLEGWRIARYGGRLSGEAFEVLRLPELRIQCSPRLDFEGGPGTLSVRGEVSVPDLLALGGPEEEAPAGPSSDVVITGVRKETPTPFTLSLDVEIRIILGDHALVKAGGVDAQLGGSVVLKFRDSKEVTGKGEIRVIKGDYSAYGVSLNIVRGRLLFAGGPVENPTLDVLALREAGDVRAGVLAGGTLREPLIRLYSEPAMPDADILAYIVLGHPLGDNREQASRVMQAAGLLLSTSRSVVLRDQVQQWAGLDTLDVESGGGEVARSLVVIGKYLTPDLYVGYGRSLFTETDVYRLRYKLSKHWQIESQSDGGSAADLYYTITFD